MRAAGGTRGISLRRCFAIVAIAALPAGVAALGPRVAHANITADTASDVCPLNANPCNVTTQIDVVNNSTLDFGTRAVSVSGGGRFNFGAGSGAIKCGNFTASPGNGNWAINASGPGIFPDTTQSGVIEIAARRNCSAVTRPCLKDTDCQLGTCSARRCSGRQTRLCSGDTDCQFGACTNLKRCALNDKIRCANNADCNFGTCPEQLTCKGDSVPPVECSTDPDCDFGTCTVGSASIDMNGPINGNSDVPAIVSLHAADSVTIRKDINLQSTGFESDGGELEMTTGWGDVQVLAPAKIDLTGGGDAAGGSLNVVAAGNFKLNGEIDCTGGGFDGGSVDVQAGKDVTVTKDINCSSVSGAGYGGEILMDAGGNLAVNGVSVLNHTDFLTQGHADIENSSGDGGNQELTAGGNLALNSYTTYQGSGAAPEGFGADMYLSSGGNFTLNGEIESKATGLMGGGGYVQIMSGGTSQVQTRGLLDLFGGSAGGGSLEFSSVGAVDFKGTADATAGSTGTAGSLLLKSDADLSFGGTLTTNGGLGGAGDGKIEMEACRITMTSTGILDNKATSGLNKLKVHESMKLQTGSKVLNQTGSNLLVYRVAKPQNVRLGTITPAPQILYDPTLAGCPVCGNGEIDQTETCDDANTHGGDGCSADCQNEKCIAQTPGYPAVPLCSDGNDCSVDTCNTALNGGTCQHEETCDDGLACTTDSCVDAQCVHDAVDASCDDANVCTNDLCSPQTGCLHVANAEPCDDAKFCTEGDHCASTSCVGSAIDCEDGVACTVDGCSEALDQCTHQPSDARCSDHLFCNGTETCDALEGCQPAAAVDCSQYDTACVVGVCDEDLDECSVQPANEGGACDDGNYCTVDDRCVAGGCAGDSRDCADTVSCTVDACNEASDQCTHQASDALCSNDVFCDGAETCNAETGCSPATAVDCSGLDGVCVTGVCDNELGACTTVPANEGGACDDGDECTSGDRCASGQCQGEPSCGVCGDGVVDEGEDCDDGDTVFAFGQYCNADCTRIPCGKPLNSTGTLPKAGDALFALRAAVGSSVCDYRICSVDGNNKVVASDALRILKAAVGQPVTLDCPAT